MKTHNRWEWMEIEEVDKGLWDYSAILLLLLLIAVVLTDHMPTIA